MNKTLTNRQAQILHLIKNCRNHNNYSPTLQEMAGILKLNKVTVFEHVEKLIKKGYIHRAANKSRSLTIVKKELIKMVECHKRMVWGEMEYWYRLINFDDQSVAESKGCGGDEKKFLKQAKALAKQLGVPCK